VCAGDPLHASCVCVCVCVCGSLSCECRCRGIECVQTARPLIRQLWIYSSLAHTHSSADLSLDALHRENQECWRYEQGILSLSLSLSMSPCVLMRCVCVCVRLLLPLPALLRHWHNVAPSTLSLSLIQIQIALFGLAKKGWKALLKHCNTQIHTIKWRHQWREWCDGVRRC